MCYKEKDLLEAIKVSCNEYKSKGPRSNKKVIPLHDYIANVLKCIWGCDYGYNYIGSKGTKEKTVDGKYYPKNIDVTISNNSVPIFCLGIKFITRNYKQNANNYFENMMGETANIQANSIPYVQFIILRDEIPHYKKDGTIDRYETLSSKDTEKYIRLMFDINHAHRPQELCIFIVNVNEETCEIKKCDYSKFGSRMEKLLNETLSPDVFFDKVKSYKNYYELI